MISKPLFIPLLAALLLIGCSAAGAAPAPGTETLKTQAYELYDQRKFDAAAEPFRLYLDKNPDDGQVAFDFATLLSQLKRHDEAAKWFEAIYQKNPQHEVAYFNLGFELVALKRYSDAEKVLATLVQSSNRDMADAAADALRRLRAEGVREDRLKAEQRIFDLAQTFQHKEVVEAINGLEKQGELSFAMEMQRLYALHSLGQFALTLERADQLAVRYPAASDLALVRADLLSQAGRKQEATALWRRIERQNAGTVAALEATRRLQAEAALEAEANVYALARQQQHAEVVAALDGLEKQGALSLPMEMQRLYAWQSLGQVERALKRAGELAATHPQAAEVALLHADLLTQKGRWDEAAAILQQITRQHRETPAAFAAEKRLRTEAEHREKTRSAERIFELARQQNHRAVLAAIDELEKEGELSRTMQMQRLYALQALGETPRAIELANEMAAANPESTDLALLRADLLIRRQKWDEAAQVLKRVKRTNPDAPVAGEIERRLGSIPAVANLDRWYWGEAYLSGDYLGRFGTVVGSGFVRHGTYIPHARWLQPFQEFRFSADTRSGVGGERSVVADNFVAFSAGLRAQPFATEYFHLYVLGGLNKDLLDQRNEGDWDDDFQGGLYGFKSWGPGTVLRAVAPEEFTPPTGEEHPKPESFFWRSDWFADVSGDFSYYKRYADWIGYGQTREGFRVFQSGPAMAVDAYAVQNVSFDTRGNYFDNLFELGPGARCLWVPRKDWQVVLRAEWLFGFYFGRDDRRTRGNAEGQYDDFRVGLSVGVRW